MIYLFLVYGMDLRILVLILVLLINGIIARLSFLHQRLSKTGRRQADKDVYEDEHVHH